MAAADLAAANCTMLQRWARAARWCDERRGKAYENFCERHCNCGVGLCGDAVACARYQEADAEQWRDAARLGRASSADDDDDDRVRRGHPTRSEGQGRAGRVDGA